MDSTQSSLRANHLVQKYLELMPEGQYRPQTEARQIEFQAATALKASRQHL